MPWSAADCFQRQALTLLGIYAQGPLALSAMSNTPPQITQTGDGELRQELFSITKNGKFDAKPFSPNSKLSA